MAAELLTRAMELADSYARRRAFCAAHPFTRETDERDAEKARDDARAALEGFLSEHLTHGEVVPSMPQTFTVETVYEMCAKAAEAERHACSIVVWMTRMDAIEPDADDKGVSGWLDEAEARIKARGRSLRECLDARGVGASHGGKAG